MVFVIFFYRIPSKIKSYKVPFDNLIDSLNIYRRHKKVLAYSSLLSLFFWFINVIAAYIVSLSLQVTIPFWYFLIVLPVAVIVSLLPISINGFGVKEGTLVVLLTKMGVPQNGSLLVAFTITGINILLSFTGGFIYLYNTFRSKLCSKAMQ